MNKKWNNCVLNSKACSSFESVSYDHRIVTAKIRLGLRKNPAGTTKTAHYDWSLLNNRDISDEYTLTQRNKFDALQEISDTLTPNDKYENFVNAYIEAVVECIPTVIRIYYVNYSYIYVYLYIYIYIYVCVCVCVCVCVNDLRICGWPWETTKWKYGDAKIKFFQ